MSIICMLDPSIEEDSVCHHCCIYCPEIKCDYRCPYTEKIKTEEKIIEICIEAYEE